MTAAHDPQREAAPPGEREGGEHLVLAARGEDLLRGEAGGAAPVAVGVPTRAGHEGAHRNAAPSPRYVGAVPTIASPATST